MRYYDFALAKEIIKLFTDLDVLEEASMGIQEDYFWTGTPIWEGGKYVKDIPDNSYERQKIFSEQRVIIKMAPISELRANNKEMFDLQDKYENILLGGITGSIWGTPVIHLNLKDGTEKIFECFTGDISAQDPIEIMKIAQAAVGGCLSGPFQDNFSQIEVEQFKNLKKE